jgi:hypothetical protein
VDYPNVKNAHIVPRTYLKNWAVDARIGVRQVREGHDLVLPVENVGTRRREYRRNRPDGTPIDDIEWTLGQGEHLATPALRSFADTWPLPSHSKRILAELFAYQLLRGPRWKEEYREAQPLILDEYRKEGVLTIDGRDYPITQEALARVGAQLGTDSSRLLSMIRVAPTITTILASMHWTLVEFNAPVVATSDHPITLWPGADSRRPQPSRIRDGLLECIEIRLPLSPRHAVLMTWADEPDDVGGRVHGNRDHARRFNAFTIASAERQWFYQPGTSVPTLTGKRLPLAPELIKSYDGATAAASRRRAGVSEEANAKRGRPLEDREVNVVSITSRDD